MEVELLHVRGSKSHGRENICRKKRRCKGRHATSAREKLRQPRQVNLCVRRWITSAKENTEHARQSRPSRSGCPRLDVQAWACRRRKMERRAKRLVAGQSL